MVKTRTKYIGTGTLITFIALLGWFINSDNFDVEVSGDIFCLEECRSYFNITSKYYTYYLYNKEGVKLDFVPEIKEYHICKPDKRCKSCGGCPEGYREIDFVSPYTKRYKYVYKFYKGKKEEFMIIGKKDLTQTVKWSLDAINKEIDPIWYGYNITKLCEWGTRTQNVYESITYEFTCQTDYFNFTLNPQFGYCYNRTYHLGNGSYTYPLNFFHSFDYGYRPNKTMYWIEVEKTGEEEVQYCRRHIGYMINNKILNWANHGYQCSKEGKIIQCDRCGDDGNCDGIWNSGESGCRFTLGGKITKECKGDTPKIRKITRRFKIE